MFDLNNFVIVRSDDHAKRDLELVCLTCDDVLCDVEHNDSLATIAGVARDHYCINPEGA